MRLSSFRALLLALAVVLQTIAGGWGVAHASTGGPGGLSAHCVKTGGAGDATHGGAPHICDACCLSAGAQPVFLPDFVSVIVEPRAFSTVGYVLNDAAGAPARFAQAPSARGPPARA